MHLIIDALNVSIHAPREGSDYVNDATPSIYSLFLSTLPVRGATSMYFARKRPLLFLSTLPVRGATRRYNTVIGQVRVSIHAPREGSDLFLPQQHPYRIGVSIHAPREGSDFRLLCNFSPGYRFLSTLPVRGATSPLDD